LDLFGPRVNSLYTQAVQSGTVSGHDGVPATGAGQRQVELRLKAQTRHATSTLHPRNKRKYCKILNRGKFIRYVISWT